MDHRTVLDGLLVDDLLNVNHSPDHPLELQDTVLPIHPNLVQMLRSTPQIHSLGKRMLSTVPNEGLPIIVLSLPHWVILNLWLGIRYNTMLSSMKAAV